MDKKDKWCFVPGCRNTSRNCNKIFFSVPKKEERKRNWFVAVKRKFPTSKSHYYCCEDHFNLKEDMVNYLKYRLVGGRLYLKPEVVPHIFCVQGYRKKVTRTQINKKSCHSGIVNEKTEQQPETLMHINTDMQDIAFEHYIQKGFRFQGKGLRDIGFQVRVEPNCHTVEVVCSILPIKYDSCIQIKDEQIQEEYT